MADANGPQLGRRLRRKTTVGTLTVGTPSAETPAATGNVTSDGKWSEEFLEEEDLSGETANLKKKVFLLTLPHPRRALPGQPDLRHPGTMTHEQVVQAVLDAFARPEYIDAGARARAGPAVKVDRMVVFQDQQGVFPRAARFPESS